MNLKSYFAHHQGTGILATADDEGRVDAAVFSSPYCLDDGRLALLLRERLTYHNLRRNPRAVYLFLEQGPGYRGLRLFLRKTGEGEDSDLIRGMTRPWLSPAEDAAAGPKHLLWFEVERALELVGDGELVLEGIGLRPEGA